MYLALQMTMAVLLVAVVLAEPASAARPLRRWATARP